LAASRPSPRPAPQVHQPEVEIDLNAVVHDGEEGEAADVFPSESNYEADEDRGEGNGQKIDS